MSDETALPLDTVLVLVDDAPAEESDDGGGYRGSPGSDEIRKPWALERSFPVEQLKKNARQIMSAINNIFSETSNVSDHLQCEEITVNLKITSSGSFAIFGTGVQGGGEAGISLKFKLN